MLTSALDDLKARTLAAIERPVARFLYLAGLRAGDVYEHWGLIRTYGEANATEALAAAHADCLATLLRTPLRELMEQMDAPSAEELKTAALPPNIGKAAAAHFNSVAAALAALAAARAGRTDRVA